MGFDADVRRAFNQLGDRLRDEIDAALSQSADQLVADAEADRKQAAAEAQAAADRARTETQTDLRAYARLADAVRALDEAVSLTAVLNTLIERAQTEAARVVLLLVRGGRVRAWRAPGFDPPLDLASIDLAIDDAAIVGEAIRSATMATTAEAGSGAPAGVPAAEGQGVAAPIVLAGEVVAVLYADTIDGREHAARASAVAIDVMTRHAARRLEALTAFMAARALFWSPPAVDGESVATEGAASATAAVDEEAARRYARLLVYEIQFYHEAEVTAGRASRDLGARLGGEIAQARVLYGQRVPATVRTDYFRAELIRTLANGDPAALGAV